MKIVYESSHRLKGHRVTLKYAEVSGRVECVGVSVESDEGRRVSASLLRFPLGGLIDKDRPRYLRGLQELSKASGYLGKALPRPQERKELAELRRRAKARIPAAEASVRAAPGRPPMYDYAEVAGVYLEAWRQRKPPTKSVAKRYGISDSAAAKLVSRVRVEGHLAKTSKGKPGGSPPAKPRRKK